MKVIVPFFILLSITLTSYGQINYPTQDSVHIFWQPNVEITFQDYQQKVPLKQVEELMEKYRFSASASVGIWSILDIPKKKRDRKRKFEKVYFAPAFERTTSFAKTNDTLEIAIHNTFFDICELWARWARKELNYYQDSIKSIGIVSVMYSTVEKEMNENRIAMYQSYFKDVIIDKRDGAFKEWRKQIEEKLKETKDYATTPAECYRLMTQNPIEEGYIKAPKIIGPLN